MNATSTARPGIMPRGESTERKALEARLVSGEQVRLLVVTLVLLIVGSAVMVVTLAAAGSLAKRLFREPALDLDRALGVMATQADSEAEPASPIIWLE